MQPTHRRAAETNHLRADLQRALRAGDLRLAFQPRRRLPDHSPAAPAALTTWARRGRGVMQGAALATAGAACGLTADLLAWTLTAACAEAARHDDGAICVGVPVAAVRDASLLPCVAAALHSAGLPPHRVSIALADTEIGAAYDDTVLSLSALRDHGIGVVLEDFGDGQACLAKLRHLPLSGVKLDCSLVRDAACDASAAALAQAVGDYARALDIEVLV